MQDFTHALMVLLSRVERLSGVPETSKDGSLKQQFIENLKDPTLCHDVKRYSLDHYLPGCLAGGAPPPGGEHCSQEISCHEVCRGGRKRSMLWDYGAEGAGKGPE